MDSRNQDDNRADLGRVLLALAVLALLSSLDDSGAPREAFAAQTASETR